MKKNTRHVSVVFVILTFLSFGGVFVSSKGHDPKHFVLVHAACLGAWSWYKLIPALKSYGHNVTAIDLAASGINLVRVNEVRTISDYSKPFIDFMESIPSTAKVILVGHSLGGLAISQAMELFPQKVSLAIFVSAVMPGPSFPFSVISQKVLGDVGSTLDNKLYYDNGPNNPPTSFIFGPKYIAQVLYQYSPPEDAALANMLDRPQPLPVSSAEEVVFSKAKYGSVKRAFVVLEKDQAVPKQVQEGMIEKTHPRGSNELEILIIWLWHLNLLNLLHACRPLCKIFPDPLKGKLKLHHDQAGISICWICLSHCMQTTIDRVTIFRYGLFVGFIFGYICFLEVRRHVNKVITILHAY